MRKKLLATLLSALIIFSFSCSKEEDAPENPYDSIDRSTNTTTPTEPDPNSIAGLHKNIFFPRCANPGCHDGTFEPDYRTVESTFSTLVYQPVNMDSIEGSTHRYSLRVIPYDVANSWLNERITTTSSDYMPSNGQRLTQSQLDHIHNWINAGCPDVNSNLPTKPNLQPNIVGYVALDGPTFTANRIDTIRLNGNPLNPFIAPSGVTMTIAFVAKDTADHELATPDSLFTVRQIEFSTNKNDFTGATIITASFYLSGFSAWIVYVPTTNWTPGTTVYFRIAVNDGQHTGNSVFPRYETIDYYKTIYAFYVQ